MIGSTRSICPDRLDCFSLMILPVWIEFHLDFTKARNRTTWSYFKSLQPFINISITGSRSSAAVGSNKVFVLQIMGWLLIASIITFKLLLICVARCTSPISYLQLKFWRLYTQEESSLLDSYTATHARDLADRNVKSFFDQASPEDIATPSNHDWEKISSLYTFSRNNLFYSTLHRFVERGSEASDNPLMNRASVKSTDSHRPAPAALSFVDSGPASL